MQTSFTIIIELLSFCLSPYLTSCMHYLDLYLLNRYRIRIVSQCLIDVYRLVGYCALQGSIRFKGTTCLERFLNHNKCNI